ncbi:MAG: SDR family oxidoreductase [Bacteroidales bacterium]|nr:SDR family oxidoreductase [Candidatus Cacconaster merdequi]
MSLINIIRKIRKNRKEVSADIYYTLPDNLLASKKIIITGGGRGLGLAMAQKFVSEGAEVLISGRNEATLKDAADAIGCKYLKLDVTKPDTFCDFINEADSMLRGVNVLVNNAGISLHEPSFFDVTEESFDAQMATNFKGPFFLAQRFLELLKKEERKGSVLFISSETGETADFRPYGFTKAAINSMVQGLAYLFSRDGIRVNAVAPGVTASDMTGFSANGNLAYSSNRLGRVYLPEEVAETACFLISDVSGCISGQIITCNNAGTVNARWKH